jgi:hypothetical protein
MGLITAECPPPQINHNICTWMKTQVDLYQGSHLQIAPEVVHHHCHAIAVQLHLQPGRVYQQGAYLQARQYMRPSSAGSTRTTKYNTLIVQVAERLWSTACRPHGKGSYPHLQYMRTLSDTSLPLSNTAASNPHAPGPGAQPPAGGE